MATPPEARASCSAEPRGPVPRSEAKPSEAEITGREHSAARQAPREPRWRLLRDLGAFVLKVALEAIRDVVLIPLALLAGLAGLVLSPAAPDRFFREVLRLGARFDDFLDLFGAAAREGSTSTRRHATTRVDDLVDGIEAVLREQHQRGGVTAAAKDAIDRALDAVGDALQERPSRNS